MPDHRFRFISPTLVLFLGLAVVLGIYSQAWTGTLFFDDEANLAGLAGVFAEGRFDPFHAQVFVFGGTAGPLGRPVALASFLLDGSAWGVTPQAFLYTNTLLHLLNALLISLVLLRIGRLMQWDEPRVLWSAVLTTLLWAALPLLASSSLMIVQRMNLLASSFMLLGLWGYLLARSHLQQRPLTSMLLMGASLTVGTLLGVLSKEQAALLPSLILVLELTLLPVWQAKTASMRTAWLAFRTFTLVAPSVVLLIYLAHIAWQGDSVYKLRDFGMAERLWTEASILWRYVFLTLIPRPLAFSPYHEDIPFAAANVTNLIAALAWLGFFALAILQRRRWPLFSFAVLWFLVAHALESTVIPLELYFEHRNYLAVMGLVFALVATLWQLSQQKSYGRLFYAIFSIYFTLQAFVLWQVTSLYGQSRLAAEVWAIVHPSSMRAQQFLAQRYVLEGDYAQALRILNEGSRQVKNSGILQLQAVQLACHDGLEPEDAIETRVQQVIKALPTSEAAFSAIPTFEKLLSIRDDGKCPHALRDENLLLMAQSLFKNPQFIAEPNNLAQNHLFMAVIYSDQGNFDQSGKHIAQALKIRPSLDVINNAAAILNCPGKYEDGLQILRQNVPQYSKNPWMRRIEQEAFETVVRNQEHLVLQEKNAQQDQHNKLPKF